MNKGDTNNPITSFEPPMEGEGFAIRDYWQVIRKRIWSVLLITALVLGLGGLYLANQVNVYEAKVTIEIRTNTPQVLGGDVEPVIDPAEGARFWSTDEYYETQYRIIRSRAVADTVVQQLGLATDVEFLGITATDPEDIRDALMAADPIGRLISMTRVAPVEGSHLVEILVENESPERAMLLADTIANVYVARNQNNQLGGTDAAYNWLAHEREILRARVEDSERALMEYRQDSEIRAASLQARQEQITHHLNSINGLRDQARADVRGLQRQRREIRRAREASDVDSAPIPAVIENDLVQRLKQQRVELRTELARLAARYGERHPDIRGVTAALDSVEEQIQIEVESILASNEVELGRAEARLDEMNDEHARLHAEMLLLSSAEPEYNQLSRNIEINADVLRMVEKRYEETGLYRNQQDVNNIETLDAAILPEIPVRPRRTLVLAAAMILGLALGLAFAFLLEVLDNTVRTQEDIERVLGFTFLGVVPSIKLRGRERQRAEARVGKDGVDAQRPDLFVHHNPKSSVAECCRSIRTNLHFMSPDKELNRLLITSAGPREGKTSTAINLATVMAQSNQKVLLLDTDMRRPRIHKALQLSNDRGLSNLILGEVDFDGVIQKCPVENLHIMACGPIPPNPTELMHTERFRYIVDELSKRYDRVIFDSPPVIAVADAMILGNLVDGVLFVVKSGQTSKEVVKRAKSHLEATNAPLLGAILNDLDLEDRAYRYHYYYSYYYRYGQYYEESPEGDELDDVIELA